MKLFKFLVKVVLHVTVTTKTPFVKYNTVWRNFYWGTSWLKKYCNFLQKKKRKSKKSLWNFSKLSQFLHRMLLLPHVKEF